MKTKYYKPKPGYNVITGWLDKNIYENKIIYPKSINSNIIKFNQT